METASSRLVVASRESGHDFETTVCVAPDVGAYRAAALGTEAVEMVTLGAGEARSRRAAQARSRAPGLADLDCRHNRYGVDADCAGDFRCEGTRPRAVGRDHARGPC